MFSSYSFGFQELYRWLRAGWGVSLLAVSVVAALLCLAAANVVVRANWNEVEDGVLWAERPEGLYAVQVASDSAASIAGLLEGDILLAVDGVVMETRRDVLNVLHESNENTQLTYTVLRLGNQELREVNLQPVPSSSLPVYFVLVGVGVFALLVGGSVRVRRPGNQATLHFFWLCVAFFGVFAFSFTGRLDPLDWTFFWADAVSTVLLAPLFIHFALVFPKRTPGRLRRLLGRWLVPIVYLPALVLCVAEIFSVSGNGDGAGFTTNISFIWQLEMAYLATCMVGGLGIMIAALRRVPSVTARRQLRWIVSGAILGGLPFAVGYAIPWAIGFEPIAGLEVTAVPLGLIPLAFASAIVRYRLHDVEVIVKRSLVYTAAVVAMAAIYLILEELASGVFLEESDGHNSIIALLATAVVVLLATPVKNTIQTMLDRVYYRDRYDYRRALVGFARDLNSDLDLSRLTERLVMRVAETLVVSKIVLLQRTDQQESGMAFVPLRWVGFDSAPPGITDTTKLSKRLVDSQTVVFDAPAKRPIDLGGEAVVWREHGLHYFIPCVSKDGTIAIMALGRKGSGEPLSSEDMALLAAVAGQVATAFENGRLYGQLQVKARELDRMRQFSEDIVESLNDGLVVLDLNDLVVRWNAGMERLYGVPKAAAVGQDIKDLFDAAFINHLRKAREKTPAGSTFYRVPLFSRHSVENSADQKRLLVNIAIAPLLTPELKINGLMLIVEDITQRVQLEEQLQISEKMASIGLLAAGVAHEVNTPLTGISSFTQMLLDGAKPDDPKTEILQKIENQTFRAAKIVNGLLNLARPGQSDASGPVDLNVVVNDVLALLEHQLASVSVKVRRELSSDPVFVEGIEFKLQQVFLNLFLNARDAMSTGGWLTIRTTIDDRQRAVVQVSDTGSGIPPEALSRIYDPFFTTKSPGQGTGLGLSITYGVVKEHHGVIECDSEPDQGTKFTLTLPLVGRPDTTVVGAVQ